jgi:cell wall-associated NlpC family hydrolase
MLLRATGGNLAGAAALAAIARKESSFGQTSGRFRNNAWGWGVHLGPEVNTAPDFETMARRVWTGLNSNLYKGAGIRTLPKIIMRYAPPNENNTSLYQRQVSEWLASLGLDPNTDIFSGGGVQMRPDGPAARASGQSGARTAQAARQRIEALGPPPSLGASFTGALMGKGSQSQNLMNATARYLKNKRDYEKKAAIASSSGPPPRNEAEADPSTDGVVRAALEQVGVDYSWGGGTPEGPTRGFGRGANTVGFDCSSLVQYAWAKRGVALPRTTYDQIKVGRAVNPRNMNTWRPGDLLFPHTGHVLLYIGNGKAVHAPQTGKKIQVVRADYRPMTAVRRPV